MFLQALCCSYWGIVRINVTPQKVLPHVLGFWMCSCPYKSQLPALAGNVHWHWQDRKSSICSKLQRRMWLKIKWEQLNKADGNLQSSPNRRWLYWLGFCIGDSQKIQTFGIRQILGAFGQQFGLLLQLSVLSCTVHWLRYALSHSSSFLRGPPALPQLVLSHCCLNSCLFFLSERRSFVSSSLCWMGLRTDLEVEWKMCETAAIA